MSWSPLAQTQGSWPPPFPKEEPPLMNDFFAKEICSPQRLIHVLSDELESCVAAEADIRCRAKPIRKEDQILAPQLPPKKHSIQYLDSQDSESCNQSIDNFQVATNVARRALSELTSADDLRTSLSEEYEMLSVQLFEESKKHISEEAHRREQAEKIANDLRNRNKELESLVELLKKQMDELRAIIRLQQDNINRKSLENKSYNKDDIDHDLFEQPETDERNRRMGVNAEYFAEIPFPWQNNEENGTLLRSSNLYFKSAKPPPSIAHGFYGDFLAVLLDQKLGTIESRLSLAYSSSFMELLMAEDVRPTLSFRAISWLQQRALVNSVVNRTLYITVTRHLPNSSLEATSHKNSLKACSSSLSSSSTLPEPSSPHFPESSSKSFSSTTSYNSSLLETKNITCWTCGIIIVDIIDSAIISIGNSESDHTVCSSCHARLVTSCQLFMYIYHIAAGILTESQRKSEFSHDLSTNDEFSPKISWYRRATAPALKMILPSVQTKNYTENSVSDPKREQVSPKKLFHKRNNSLGDVQVKSDGYWISICKFRHAMFLARVGIQAKKYVQKLSGEEILGNSENTIQKNSEQDHNVKKDEQGLRPIDIMPSISSLLTKQTQSDESSKDFENDSKKIKFGQINNLHVPPL